MQQLTLFDYGQLTEPVREELQNCAVCAKEELLSVAGGIVKVGKHLTRARDLAPDLFEEWARAEFGYALRTAQKYVRIYEIFGGYDLSGFGYVTVEVLTYLARDKVPPAAQKEAVQLLNEGQELTRGDAEKLVNKHVPPLIKEYEQIVDARDKRLKYRFKVDITEQLSGCMSGECDYPIATRAHRIPHSILNENHRILLLCPNCHNTYDTLFRSYWKADSGKRAQFAQVLREAFGDTPGFKKLDDIAQREVEWLENYEEEQAELAAHVNGRNGNGTA